VRVGNIAQRVSVSWGCLLTDFSNHADLEDIFFDLLGTDASAQPERLRKLSEQYPHWKRELEEFSAAQAAEEATGRMLPISDKEGKETAKAAITLLHRLFHGSRSGRTAAKPT
jgi:hypothetical protein